MSKKFDKKFGADFAENLPTVPGVYLAYDTNDVIVYVGKAKNLRRRLRQYRNAKRFKKHHKMRAVVESAHRIEIRVSDSDLDALLLETQLIQKHRPKLNVAGAFYFLYPMLGLKFENGVAYFSYTTQPEIFPDFSMHGAFRSRYFTREGFFALMELLAYVGHRIPPDRKSKRPIPKYSYIYGFRQLPQSWIDEWAAFFRGESKQAMETLILALVENAGARRASDAIQERINDLKRFWRHEAAKLARMRKTSGHSEYPVSQADRDILLLKHRAYFSNRTVQLTHT